VTSPEAEAEVGRGRDLLSRPKLRPRPRSGVAMTPLEAEVGSGEAEPPVAPEAELGRGRDLLLLVLSWWLAQ
jgi:hypothetical protein